MRLTYVISALACCLVCGADWCQFRGPNGASVSEGKAPPASWNEESIAWVADLPGRGPSGPIVVEGRVFVTCSGGANQDRLFVVCVDARSGKRLWQRQFWATGRTLCHPFSAVAAPTPASDGRHVFAFFASNDLICLDLDGNLVWYRGLAFDYPQAGNDAGMGASPVVVADTVVVQIENQGDSFAAGIDSATGETRWRIPRDRVASWSSPVAFPGTPLGQHAVVLQSPSGLTAHDALTGAELWRLEENCAPMTSPAVAGQRIYVPADGLKVFEWKSGGSRPSLVWESSRLRPNPPSVLVTGDQVYAMNSAGVITCADGQTGDRLWQLRVPGKHWSTPVIAGDRMYCFNQDGQAHVVQLGAAGKVISSYDFGETILCSPAVVDGALYVRSDSCLWKIAGD